MKNICAQGKYGMLISERKIQCKISTPFQSILKKIKQYFGYGEIKFKLLTPSLIMIPMQIYISIQM